MGKERSKDLEMLEQLGLVMFLFPRCELLVEFSSAGMCSLLKGFSPNLSCYL